MAGGEVDDFHHERGAYILDWTTESWTKVSDVPGPSREGHSCGYLPFEDRVVVAGGSTANTTEIFDLKTRTWAEPIANPTGRPIYGAAIAPYYDSFLYVGGSLGNLERSGGIFYFDGKNETWIELDERMKTPRSGHVSLTVPDYILPC